MIDTIITVEALEKLPITGYITLNNEDVDGTFESVIYIKEDTEHIKLLDEIPKLHFGGEMFNTNMVNVIHLNLLINENRNLHYSAWISNYSQNNSEAIIESLRFQSEIKIKIMNKAGKIIKQYVIGNSIINLIEEYISFVKDKVECNGYGVIKKENAVNIIEETSIEELAKLLLSKQKNKECGAICYLDLEDGIIKVVDDTRELIETEIAICDLDENWLFTGCIVNGEYIEEYEIAMLTSLLGLCDYGQAVEEFYITEEE